ncbi:MAG TPA: S-methyl-5-thioribose-1-phosphate isomerase [Saprospiraceae bacterium]|nr:S-methyl-5-thioribose-1-phosphate isomerase [Saprospiraceae bacterium]HMQ82216.1 S-methyl-5-thioribose-1-phosphate isomerase [Saprospiraceae bacterium]
MKIEGIPYRTIWLKTDEPGCIQVIDQRYLPHQFIVEDLRTVEDVCYAIQDMHVRGAPLIGSTAAYGMYLAALHASEQDANVYSRMQATANQLKATRPTAVNLAYAVDRILAALQPEDSRESCVAKCRQLADEITEENVVQCKKIGEYGLALIETIARQKAPGQPVHILTHCNAGWLACIDYGTATAPIYAAHEAGIPVHVWVDETRPRNQGANITAFELLHAGVPHTVIADNTGGHLMQHGMVDMVIVGSDRTTRRGDVANKIGTYLKALAAKDNNVPFYVALPISSFDFSIADGLQEIPIEKRSEDEVKFIQAWSGEQWHQAALTPKDSPAANYAFDVTPARLVSGLITELGICQADEAAISRLLAFE